MGVSDLGWDIVKVGEVVSTDPKKVTARVKFPDLDEVITYNYQVMQLRTKEDRDYWMPDIGQQVICLLMGNGLECGFVAGALYSEKDPPPVECQDKRHCEFKDGSWFEYDRAEHKLKGHVEGNVDLFATGDINIKAGGTVYVTGKKVRWNDPDAPANCAEKKDG